MGAEGVVVPIVVHLGGGDGIAGGVKNGDIGFSLHVEVDGRHIAETAQGIADGGCEHLPDGLFVLEFDLRLRGMDIHVDRSRIDIDI